MNVDGWQPSEHWMYCMFARVFAVVMLWIVIWGGQATVQAQDGILPNASQQWAADGAPMFLMLTEQNPPFNYTNQETGAIVGASVELVHEIMRRAGFQYEIRIMPWRRAFNQAQGRANVCLFSMNYTAERASLFKWVKPLYSGGIVFYARADDPKIYASEEDIKGNVLLARTAEATKTLLETIAGVAVVTVENDLAAFDLLERGRGDLLLTGQLVAKTLLTRSGRLNDFRLAYELRPAEVSLGCSLKTSDSAMAKLIEANEGLDGFRGRVLDRYWNPQ